MTRILVTGSRSWTDGAAIRSALAEVYEPGAVLVSGACPRGADAIAEAVWLDLGGEVERHPADWEAHRRATGRARNPAGLIRNRDMVATEPDLCLAFIRARSAGASHCAGLARSAGIPTRVYREDVYREDAR